MKLSTAVIIGCAAWLNTSALCAADITPELHEAAVRVAVTTCANCHGAQGRSANPKFPRLAAQHATYLVTQMKNFKSQTRGDPDALGYMWGMAAPLSDELIGALADYYSTQTAAAGGYLQTRRWSRAAGISTKMGWPAKASRHVLLPRAQCGRN